jgi:hypothetical protein
VRCGKARQSDNDVEGVDPRELGVGAATEVIAGGKNMIVIRGGVESLFISFHRRKF